MIPSNTSPFFIHHIPSTYNLHFTSLATMNLLLISLLIILPILFKPAFGDQQINACRSYCGNITVDYPFTTKSGCGHPGFRDLLFCVNDVLMFHITSGSYRVLDIDYSYQALTLNDPYMSTCHSIVRGKGNGFVLETWRAPYLNPVPDNVFMLIGCTSQSPLFQGFPGKHLPCRNVSGMGCEEYYGCPAWDLDPKSVSKVHGANPPECCSVSFEAIRAINLTRLECEGYSSAYSLAPLRLSGPKGWSYGIRVTYSLPDDHAFCRACEATGGTCGHDPVSIRDLCLCEGWNSTSNCDTVISLSPRTLSWLDALAGVLACTIAPWMVTL